MKNEALFSSKHKSKKSKCRLLQFLFGALRARKMLQGYGYTMFCAIFSRGNNFHNFMFAFLEDETLPKEGLLVHLQKKCSERNNAFRC